MRIIPLFLLVLLLGLTAVFPALASDAYPGYPAPQPTATNTPTPLPTMTPFPPGYTPDPTGLEVARFEAAETAVTPVNFLLLMVLIVGSIGLTQRKRGGRS